MVLREFPGFVVVENPERRGSVASRDRMLRLASADIVVSLDDDSYPVQPGFPGAAEPPCSKRIRKRPSSRSPRSATTTCMSLSRYAGKTAAVATSRPMPTAAPPCVAMFI